MATLQEEPRSYSTLERLQDDETVRAPQALGPATTAGFDDTPEVDGANLAPEVLPGTRPEVFYSTLPPEAVDADNSDSFQRSQDSIVDENTPRKRTKWGFVALALVLVVAALAIGLGIGFQRKNKPTGSSPATPIPSILNDSSLAAIISANNDRHLFFQGPQGVIRRMIYRTNNNQWITDPGSIAISDAKYLTPLALELYYITKSNHINTSLSSDDGWSPGGDISLDYTTDSDTRQLSITSIAGTNDTQGPNQSLLLYEDSGGNVAALLQVQESEPGQGLYWLDVSRNNNSIPRSDFSPVYFDVGYSRFSSTLHESVPGAKLRPPFISWPSIRLHGLGLEVELLVCARGSREQAGDPFDNVTSITYQSWANASHGYFSSFELSFNFSTKAFDLAILNIDDENFVVWVNGTEVCLVEGCGYRGNIVPQVSFPFTRLASINVPEKSPYLYHQINETTLAEEQYDFSLHEWLTTYITVPILNTSVEDFQSPCMPFCGDGA